MDVDAALAVVGGYKRWHIAIFSFLGIFGFMPLCWHGLSIVFLGLEPRHHCRVPEGQLINETIPWVSKPDGEEGAWHQCKMYVNQTVDNATTGCTNGWTYTEGPASTSIVADWDLVCDDRFWTEMSQTIYQAGGLFGEMFCSLLVDRYGRKKVFIGGTLFTFIFGAATCLSSGYIVFVVLRFFTGIAVLAVCWAAETLMMEIFDSKKRSFVGISLEAFWVIVYLLLGFFAYFIRNWRYLQLALSLAVLPAMGAIWILPESPMWLVVNNKEEEAEEVLQKMARWNGVKVQGRLLAPSTSQQLLKKENSHQMASVNGGHASDGRSDVGGDVDPPVYPWYFLFTDSTLRILTIVSSIIWFANSLVYYALILATPSMAGNLYVNFQMGGILEIPADVLAYVLIVRWGRRWPTVVLHVLAGITLVVVVLIPAKTGSGVDLSILSTVVAHLGKFIITTVFAIIILYTKEIFPTNLRASSGGISCVPARLATMAAPFGSYAAKRIPWLPNVILASVSVFAAVATVLLPETLNQPLPQSIEDVDSMYRGQRSVFYGWNRRARVHRHSDCTEETV